MISSYGGEHDMGRTAQTAVRAFFKTEDTKMKRTEKTINELHKLGLITRDEAAKILNIDPRKVSELVKKNRIRPYYSEPGAKHAYGYYKVDVENFAKQQQHTQTNFDQKLYNYKKEDNNTASNPTKELRSLKEKNIINLFISELHAILIRIAKDITDLDVKIKNVDDVSNVEGAIK